MVIVKGVTMTAIMKIVKLLECDKPVLVDQFTSEYRKALLKNVSSKEIESCKILVERYIDKYLSPYIIMHKIYSYKFLESIIVEFLLKPVETANIMEYHLYIEKDNCKLERIR